jgi:hypothetical protein
LENSNTDLVAAFVVVTTLAIAYLGYMMGWRSSGREAAKYAKWTLYLGAFQWLLVVLLVLAVWNDIIYNATFSIEGYYWWLDPASYAVVLGAIFFTILGVIAVFRSRVASTAPSTRTPFPPAPSFTYAGQPSPREAPTGVRSPPGPGSTTTNATRFCTNCGARIAPGASFCSNCGKRTTG